MNRIKIICSIFLLLTTSGIYAQNNYNTLFQEANQLYQKQNYNQAIQKYEQITADKVQSFEVFFNLGNAYYKTGNFTKAILNYERAKKIKPDDEEVLMNLAIANQNTLDKIEAAPKVFYEQWWENYLSESTSDQSAVTLIIFFWLTIVTVALFLYLKNIVLKKTAFFAAFIFLAISIFYFAVTGIRQKREHASQEGLIISQSALIKSSPDDKGTNLFMLHEGTKINILDELGYWKKIRIPNGNEGWIKSKDIETI